MHSRVVEDNSTRRRWAKAVLFSFAECIVIVVIVLLANASHIRTMSPGSSSEIGLGPIHLVHIEKSALQGGGYALTYSFYKSLAGVLAVCFTMELWMLWKFSGKPEGAEPVVSDDKP
jgi:hypothetical protein